MSRRLHLTTLSLGFLVSLSCNSARINEAPECAAGDTSCDGTTVTKPQPKPMPGASKIRIGPKAPIGFDTKQDGSYGVQTDKDGNVILDPAMLDPLLQRDGTADATVQAGALLRAEGELHSLAEQLQRRATQLEQQAARLTGKK